MDWSDVLEKSIVTILGSGVMVGGVLYFTRRALERRISEKETQVQREKQMRTQRAQVEDELNHAYGRMLFWLYRSVVTGTHNGELDEAWRAVDAAERKKKILDREILSEHVQ